MQNGMREQKNDGGARGRQERAKKRIGKNTKEELKRKATIHDEKRRKVNS